LKTILGVEVYSLAEIMIKKVLDSIVKNKDTDNRNCDNIETIPLDDRVQYLHNAENK